jgi:small subunit ribosomal protein S6
MRRYELMLLLRPDLEDEKLQSAVEKVTRAIVNAGGSLSKVSPWGKRRLAYEIQHYREASYFLIHFDIQPSEIREIERGMLITEEILRHLVTVLDERPELTEDELAAAAAEAVEAPATGDEEEPAEAEAAEEEPAGDEEEPAAPEPAAATTEA